MKYRYIITNTMEGQMEGTSDEAVARELAESEDVYVVDVVAGRWLMPGGVEQEVKGRD
ncbi:hypothetical protein VWT76_15560 [Xanthomonas citri pv. citri]|uniref:hypothetical protein n=1 Tax=Xanthomonas citri TaxID=346 RepID=UPI0013F5E1C2|nr:hypothetical protein [Xanthomonas citri]MBD5034913.1 hypothetical protein [Xanthomonas citri pv. citri]MBD5054803.1 hypothetical protein [Xanthomonas citri pv. citri]